MQIITRRLATAGLVALGLACAGGADAALVDRGNGLIYDTVLDVTWLQNANAAAGSSFDDGELTTDGIMTWASAMSWVDGLTYADSTGTVYSDWRLPQIRPVNGVAFDYAYSNTGSADIGNNISAQGSAYPGSTASELAYMYYTNLGNLGYFDLSGNFQPDQGLLNTGPFLNLNSRGYWAATEYAPDPGTYAFLLAGYGTQGIVGKGDFFTPWALRDGDVSAPVPLPAAAWLFGSACAGLLALTKRRRIG
jgi:hypothetical protein